MVSERRFYRFVLAVAFVTGAGIYLAPIPAFAMPPDQFYTDGRAIGTSDVWDYELNVGGGIAPPTGFNFTGPFVQTWHFFRRQPNDIIFRQQYLRQYVGDPQKRLFYFNVETGVWTGFYDDGTKQYSRLRKDARRNNLRDIDPKAFLPLDDLPNFIELGKQPCNRRLIDYGTKVETPPDVDFRAAEKRWKEKNK